MPETIYIGPAYKNHRGGIGAVLEVYSRNIKPFLFISTYENKSIVKGAGIYFGALIRLMYLMVADRSIKILHIHSASRGSFFRKSIIVLIGKLFGRKTILHIHGAEFHIFYERRPAFKPYIRFIMRKTDVVICLSETWREYFSTHFQIKKLEVIKNVIDKVVPMGTPVQKNGRVNFLFLGYIGQRKGIFDLLKVLETNRETFGNKLTLTIGGNGEVEQLEKMLVEKRFADEVKYAGWVSGNKKNELLQECDVYILPSHNEGLPISILEAMAYGKPIISTRVGGIPEIVKPGYNGWLFDAGDEAALQSIIKEVLENKGVLKGFGDNSLLMSESYTPEAVVHSLEVLYKQLL